MNTLSEQLFVLLALGLGGDDWQGFVDRYEEKYDAVQIDGFTFAPTQLNYTFQQLIASTGATTLPAYVDPESPGYEAALRTLKGRSDSIPTQKKFYRLNRVIVQEKLQLLQKFGNAVLTPEMEDVFMGLLDESADGLIESYYNALTHPRMRIVSTGKFVIGAKSNPRGLQGIEISFGIANDHFENLTGEKRFWKSTEHIAANEGQDSDPVLYFKNKIKWIRRTKHYYGPLQIEIASDLYDDLMTHSAVLSHIGHSLYPSISDDALVIANAQNLDDEALKAKFEKLVGAPFVPRDSFAYVDAPGVNENGEKDLITTQIANFEPTNVAFVPQGSLGTIMGVEPLTLGYDPEKVARFNGGRLILSQRDNPETHSLYIESEAAQICVPDKPQAMFISTVTA